jgi:hypothetical protein
LGQPEREQAMLLQTRTVDFLTRVSADVIFGAIVLS